MAGNVNPGKKSSTADGDKNFWATSWKQFFDAVHLYGRPFEWDVAAEKTTTKTTTATYFGLDLGDDALALDWPADWWCNPPFDRKVEFIQHAREQARNGRPGMMLLPYEPVSNWWRDNLKDDVIVYEPDGRYNFMERDGKTLKDGVNFGSALVLFTTATIGLSLRIPYDRGIGDHLWPEGLAEGQAAHMAATREARKQEAAALLERFSDDKWDDEVLDLGSVGPTSSALLRLAGVEDTDELI